MKAKILSMALVICMLVSLIVVFPASAETVTTVTSKGTTVINHLAYSKAYNSDPEATDSSVLKVDGASSMVVRTDGCFVEYTLNVEEAGYYNLGIDSTALNINLQTWDAYVDDVKQMTFSTWYQNYKDIVGDIYLPEGKHVLKLEPKTGHYWKYLLGITLTRKEIQSKSYWTIGKNYDTTSGRLEGDKLVLAGETYAEYKVNVPEAGTYLMSLQHHYNFDGLTSKITVNGTTEVTGAKLISAYTSDATRTTERMFSPVAMVTLNAGENTIRFDNTTSNNSFYIWQLILEKSAGQVLSATDYDSSIGTRLEGMAVVIGAGSTTTYNVDIQEDGLYAVSVYSGSTANTVGEYSVSVDGELKAMNTVLFPDWRAAKKQELCRIDLEAGERVFTIGASYTTSGHYFKRLMIEKVDEPKAVSADNAVVIEDEIKNVIAADSYVNNDAAELSITESGNVKIAPWGKATYKVNALRDGIYTLSVKYAADNVRTVANVNLDGKTAMSSRLQASTETAMITDVLCDVTLTKGVHEIELCNSAVTENRNSAVYVEEIYLEEKTRPSEAIYMWAGNYSEVINEGERNTGIEGPGIALRPQSSVTYNVFVPEAGVYRLDVMAGNGNVAYEILVDGEDASWVTGILQKRYTAGISEQVWQSICDVYFETEGVHTLTLANPTGGDHYLNKIRLDKLAGAEETSIFRIATGYSEGTNVTTEGGNVRLGNGTSVTYDASTFTAGWYKVSMLCNHNLGQVADVKIAVNDEAATFVGQTVGTGGDWTAIHENVLGNIYLPEGSNTITITQVAGGTQYFYAVILEPVILEETTTVSGKTTKVDLQSMLGEQVGGEPMVAGGLAGVRIFEGNGVSYDLDVLEAGKYNVYVTTSKDHMIASTVNFSVASGDASYQASISNPNAVAYPIVKVGTFDLAEGVATIGFDVAQDFALGKVVLEKVGDVDIALINVTETADIITNAVVEGDYTAKITLDDESYAGKNLMCTFAVYETDANGVKKLCKVASSTGVVEADSLTLPIEGITVEDGVKHSVKVFVWDAVSLYGENAEF